MPVPAHYDRFQPHDHLRRWLRTLQLQPLQDMLDRLRCIEPRPPLNPIYTDPKFPNLFPVSAKLLLDKAYYLPYSCNNCCLVIMF